MIRFSAGTFEKVPTKIFYSKNTFSGQALQYKEVQVNWVSKNAFFYIFGGQQHAVQQNKLDAYNMDQRIKENTFVLLRPKFS